MEFNQEAGARPLIKTCYAGTDKRQIPSEKRNLGCGSGNLHAAWRPAPLSFRLRDVISHGESVAGPSTTTNTIAFKMSVRFPR